MEENIEHLLIQLPKFTQLVNPDLPGSSALSLTPRQESGGLGLSPRLATDQPASLILSSFLNNKG